MRTCQEKISVLEDVCFFFFFLRPTVSYQTPYQQDMSIDRGAWRGEAGGHGWTSGLVRLRLGPAVPKHFYFMGWHAYETERALKRTKKTSSLGCGNEARGSRSTTVSALVHVLSYKLHMLYFTPTLFSKVNHA